MLTKPFAGWSDILIGSFSSRVSYLTDVASDILEALIERKKANRPTCVFCDAEGYEFYMIFGYTPCITLVGCGEPFGREEGIGAIELWNNPDDVAKEVYWDIKNNLSDWVLWDINIDVDDSDYESLKFARAIYLTDALAELADLYGIDTTKS